ncbi:MAG: TonB-dependent receptor [Flavobacteriaceae bacterium]|nr:TonB-dependent receptor [Flavobacteriaceae bacterium]MDG2387303.1 TonB-dependent receptor [Flavobacteriaceae bacterium]
MKKLEIKFIVGLLVMFTSVAFAQTEVSGTIFDTDGNPIPGATVIVNGTTQGTTTDFDGNYSISVSSDQSLQFSSLGFSTQIVRVGSQSSIDVTLQTSAEALDEIVVTGYGTQTKRETTGAISTVSAEDLNIIPSGNIEQQFQGRIPGVTVISNGSPGSTSQIRVRGFGAFGGNEPLYVVDGVPTTNIDFLNPGDIESTTVLKDAAAASIYGARAANGVIVMTTKSGSRTQESGITLDYTLGLTDPNVAGSPEMLTPLQMAQYTHIGYENNAAANGTPVAYTHPQYGTNATPVLPDYLHANGANGIVGSVDLAAIQAAYDADPLNTFLIKANKEGSGTNWYDAITNTAPLHRFSLGANGGNEKGRYYIGMGSQFQDGILINNILRRHTLRANSKYDITDFLSVGENIQATYRETKTTGGGGSITSADDESEILAAYRMPSIIPVYDEFGSYASTKATGFNNPRNPVRRLTENGKDDTSYSLSVFGNIYADLKIIDGLTVRSSLGGSVSNYYYQNYNYPYLGDSETEAAYTFAEGAGKNISWVFANTVTFDQKFGLHGVKVLAGVESLNTGFGRQINGNGINPFSQDLNFVNMSTVANPQVNSGLYNGVNFFSTFGKLDYNFNEKYYVSGTIRRDGASRFGINSRYGVFPAFSGAWRVTSESFMQGLTWIDDLKVRGGWGEMGNSNNVDPANQYSLFASNRGRTFYPISGQNNGVDQGFAVSRIGNPNAQWETSVTTNIGFDVTLFNNKVDIILDWWKKDTRDLLYQIPLAGVTGNYASAPAVNIASMLNQGLDLSISNRGSLGEGIAYEVTLNSSFLKNEIVSLAEGIEYFDGGTYRGIAPVRNAVGQSLSTFFGYQVEGYFNSQAEADASDQQGAGLGRFKYADVNGDGSITPDDRTYIGSPVPDWTGGLNLNIQYQNFSLNTYFYASVGAEIFNQSKWFTDFFGSFEGSNKGVRALESWTPALGNNAAAPIWESASNLSTNGVANSWYVEPGDFLRLQSLALSYDFEGAVLETLGLSDLSIGISGNNLLTITNYSGLDPMIGGADTNFGIDVGNYPVTPSYLLNIKINK